jgi:hypothetical protein
MPFFKSEKLLYLHVPKTGGMSIEKYFYHKYNITEQNKQNLYGWYLNREDGIRVPDERSLQHFTYNEITNSGFTQYFSFLDTPISNNFNRIIVSVRNPYDRFISELFWNKQLKFNKQNPTPLIIESAIRDYLYNDSRPFDNHRLPQYQFMLDGEGNLLKNINIVRCESLVTDMHNLGYTDFIECVNTNTVKIDYRSLLNQESRKMIEEYYRMDFEYFGYLYDIRFDPPMLIKKKHETTIVTAFITDINKNRDILQYVEYGKKLLSVSVPKIIFMEKKIIEKYFIDFVSDPLCEFIICEKEDIYLYNYRDQITNFSLISDNPTKNTLEYIFVQCNKTEWISQAIDLNIFKSDQYIWIDFGIYHMMKSIETEKFEKSILEMCNKKYDKLRIAACKPANHTVTFDVYKIITWAFAGSVFGGNCESLLKFTYLVKNEVLKTINQRHSLMWEINIWYLIKLKNIDFMSIYTCGHDIRLLELY